MSNPNPTTSSLTSRLQELRETSTPFPLAAYLHIYQAAIPDCYNNYFEGMKLLVNFLGAPQITALQNGKEEVRIPFLLRSYDLQELAKVLYPSNRALGENLIYKELTSCQ